MDLGLIMLGKWMWATREKVGRKGSVIIFAQVVSSAWHGLLPSVLVGTAAALLSAHLYLVTNQLQRLVSAKSVGVEEGYGSEHVELLLHSENQGLAQETER